MPDLVKGKKILVMGLRNKWSIAWGITRRLHEEGAQLAFTFQGEREREGVEGLVRSLGAATAEAAAGAAAETAEAGAAGTTAATAEAGAAGTAETATAGAQPFMLPCDVGSDDGIDAAFAEISRRWGCLDGVVHAIAHARKEDLQNDFICTSRDGFLHALDISAYSLVYVSRKAAELMPRGGSIVTLTFMGSERVFPGYNVMGVAKAALEASVRYLASSLGPRGVRVNAISSGPVKTISSKAVRDFAGILGVVGERAPLRRGVGAGEVGASAAYLLSELSSAVTGEIHYVDCGYNIMA